MNLKKLTVAGVFCGVLAVLSQFALPLPGGVPLTLQTFGVALCGFCLGWRYGGATVAVYLLLGAVGLPVYSSFGGGIGWLLGPSGGFLWGFLPLAVACGSKNRPIALGGLAACHLLGVIQLAAVTGNSLWQAFLVGSLPYLLKDVLTVLAARWLAGRLPQKFF
ncbi:MAG: biotin transporter BioY [Clostridia bacterium]|nr:biotin transporter BioY [Clostridia bacterium]